MPAFSLVGVVAVLLVQAVLGLLVARGWRRTGLSGPRVTAVAIALLGLVALVVTGSILGMILADLLLVGGLFLLDAAVWPRRADA